MSVTYIPAPDIGRDLLDAYQTISNVRLRQQQLAIDQQLAQSHLQDAVQQRQLLAAKTRMATQEADEFQSPDMVQARHQRAANDAALSGQAVKEGDFKLNTINPLQATSMGLQNQQHTIAVEEAKKRLAHIDKYFQDEDALHATSLKAMEAELQMKGVQAAVARQLAPIQVQQGLANLVQTQNTLKMQGQEIERGAKELNNYDEKQRTQKLGAVMKMAIEGGNPSALGSEFPEFKGVLDQIPSTVGQKNPVQAITKSLYDHYMSTGDPATADALASILEKHAKTPAQIQNEQFMKMNDPNYTPPESEKQGIIKALEVMQKNPKARLKGGLFEDSSTSPYVPPEGDTLGGGSTQGQPTQGVKVQSGTTPLSKSGSMIENALRGGTATATPDQPKAGTPVMKVQSGSIKLDTGKVTDAFDDMESWISKHKDDAQKTFHSNAKGGKTGVEFVARHAADVGYYTGDDGTIYNSTEYQTKRTKDPAIPVGGSFMPPTRTDPTSVIKDKDFESLVKDNFVKDPSATAAQEGRYRTILGQMAKGFNEDGTNGIKEVAQVVRKKYKKGTDSGITDQQAYHISQIVRHYGVQLDGN